MPDNVELHIGNRLRQKRLLYGLSQVDLGKSLGITYQQIQKYEKGLVRIGGSRLYQISQFFDVSVSYFFEGLDERKKKSDIPIILSEASSKEIGELTQLFYSIEDPKLRKSLKSLLKQMAAK